MAEQPFSDSWQRLRMRKPPEYIHHLLTNGMTEPADHSATARPRPSWFDETLYKRGQECFHHNCLTLMMLHLVGLLQILNVPSILSVLIDSGKSATRETAFLRYLETVRMVIGWYRGDVFHTEQRSGRRMRTVDGRHSRAFRHAAAAGAGRPSQYDMVLTQWAFCGYALLREGPETGLLLRPGYLDGLAHFWRCVGYRLGIPDSLNMCGPDLATARRRADAILQFVMWPLLADLPAHPRFVPMSNAMLEGMQSAVKMTDPRADPGPPPGGRGRAGPHCSQAAAAGRPAQLHPPSNRWPEGRRGVDTPDETSSLAAGPSLPAGRQLALGRRVRGLGVVWMAPVGHVWERAAVTPGASTHAPLDTAAGMRDRQRQGRLRRALVDCLDFTAPHSVRCGFGQA
ncbi:uncharacterized protein LOC119093310 isoform X2 [Pollicipes pollicipes]|uniref:uncharacterized protein LOC119093310 isoform X2 n=1 Tax=Pollicipes pollicipes TaxID=41117 RepID=UPI001885343C|nr:uncharacterized protein LOC119093310 isoform X2 [Pollicipes pollicipes]